MLGRECSKFKPPPGERQALRTNGLLYVSGPRRATLVRGGLPAQHIGVFAT